MPADQPAAPRLSPSPPVRRRRGRWLAAALLLLLLLGGTAYYGLDAQPAVAPASVPVTRGDIEQTVTALGSLQPKDYVDVGAQVSGQLKTIHVEIGDEVKEGQLLAEIDPRVFQARVDSDQAQLKSLHAQLAEKEAQLALAKQQDARNQRLFAAKAVSEDLLQTGMANVKVIEAQIAALEAQIEQAQSTLDGDLANLEYTKIYAPMAGTVVTIDARQGQTLNANQSAPIILRIADLDTMTVSAQVAEADVVRLAVGMPVHFSTLGLPDRRWQGEVRQILPTPEVINNVVLYNALIDVENEERLLMTQMSVQVFFVVAKAENALLVPVAALQPVGDGLYNVQVAGPQGPQTRQVRVGLKDRINAEVLSGLEEGNRVLLPTASAGRGGGGGGFGGFRL